MIRTRWLLLLPLLVAAAPVMALAQNGQPKPPVKEYRPLPYGGGGLALVLKEQMEQAKGTDGRFQALIDEIRKNPKKYEGLLNNKDLLKQGGAAKLDPATRDQLEKLIKDNGGPKGMEQALALKKQHEDFLKNGGKGPDPANPATWPPEMGPKGRGQASRPQDEKPDPFENFTRWVVDKTQGTSLKQYSAFQKFEQNYMDNVVNGGGQKGEWSGNGIQDAFTKIFSKDDSAANGGTPNVGLPDPGPLQMPGTTPESPSAPVVPSLSGLGGAGGSLGGLAGAGGGFLIVQILLIVAVFVVAAVVVWRLLGRARQTPQVAAAGLGPWPVDPARISTREQLVLAFEYLALLLLGNPARCANHRDIADSLTTTPEQGHAADELASLYEKARYDPASSELPPAEMKAARRDLCFLAGRAASVSGEG